MVDYLTQHSLYIVMGVILVTWLGIYLYLLRIERKIKRLERGSQK